MPGEAREIGVRSGAGEDLCVACRHNAPPLAFQGPCHNGGPGSLLAYAGLLVHEVDQILRQAHRYLLAHTKMVAVWDSLGGVVSSARAVYPQVPVHRINTGVPIGMRRASCWIRRLGTRMQPWDGRPGIRLGWFVPWTPITPPPGQSLRRE